MILLLFHEFYECITTFLDIIINANDDKKKKKESISKMDTNFTIPYTTEQMAKSRNR